MYQDDVSDFTDYSNHPVSARFSFSHQVVSNWSHPRIVNKKLKKLYSSEREGCRLFPEAVVKAFFKQMSRIEAINDEHELKVLKCLYFHELEGKRKGEYSIRLTGNWRLIARIESDDLNRYLVIVGVEDYH